MVKLLELLAICFLVGGIFFNFVAVIGLVRLPDIYTRAHSASKSDTLGAGLILAAIAVVLGLEFSTIKIVLLLFFIFLTNPTAAHAIVRAAQDQGIEPWNSDKDKEKRGGV